MPKPIVLLTGATGFLGSHLLEALLNQGYSAVVLKRSTSNLWRIEHLVGRYKSYDVDNQSIEQAFKEQRIDFIMHTACHYGRKSGALSEVVDSNVLFGLKVLELAIAHQVSTFINTDSLLPRDLNPYSLSKKQFVDWLRKESSKIQVINLKLEHMYGPKDDQIKFIAWLISQLKNKAPQINLTSGIQKRDFIYVEDVVSAFLCVLQNSEGLSIFSEFEVGTGDSIELRAFVESLKQAFERLYGSTNTKLNFGAVPYRQGEIMELKVDNQALQQLGWQPKVSLMKGLEHSLKESV